MSVSHQLTSRFAASERTAIRTRATCAACQAIGRRNMCFSNAVGLHHETAIAARAAQAQAPVDVEKSETLPGAADFVQRCAQFVSQAR